MNVINIGQLDKESLSAFDFDLIVTSSGYETRASYFVNNSGLDISLIKNKYVLNFTTDTSSTTRIENDHIFLSNNFISISCSGSSSKEIIHLIDESIKKINKNHVYIIIDYSSMTRIWYGAIIHYLKTQENISKTIHLIFTYTEAEFLTPPDEEPETINFSPIKGFCNLSIPAKPTALIIGLGYEKKRAFGLMEYFDAEVVNYFLTENSQYTDEVLSRNKEILENIDEECIFPYSLSNLLLTQMMLHDLCDSLSQNYRIILAPCGPKPFTLLSFIVASKNDNIDLWRISAKEGSHFVDRKPTGNFILLETIWI
ncbi:MAG: hypothetical protein H6Q15_2239 [Bacteroidetes bacterium]|nr:hypothetical protein [Bacteroidota bacterium]